MDKKGRREELIKVDHLVRPLELCRSELPLTVAFHGEAHEMTEQRTMSSSLIVDSPSVKYRRFASTPLRIGDAIDLFWGQRHGLEGS